MRQTDVVRQENGCSLEGLAESRIIGHAYVRGVPSRFGRKLGLGARMELANNPGAKRAVDHANRDGPDASPRTLLSLVPFIHERSGHVPLDDGNLDRRRLPRTHNRKGCRLANAVGPNPLKHVAEAADRLPIPSREDVALKHAGLVRRAVHLDADHHQSVWPRKPEATERLLVEAYRSQAQPEIAATNTAMREEALRHALDGLHWNAENRAPRAVDRHPERAAIAQVDQGTAFRAMIEPESKAQEAGDMSAAHAAPGPTGNRDRSDMGDHAFGPASDSKRQVACPEIAARTRHEWGEIFAVADPEHRHVRRRIAPRQLRPDAPPIWNSDRDILICFQGFLGGDDGAATPDKTAKGGSVPPMDGHDTRPDSGDVAP